MTKKKRTKAGTSKASAAQRRALFVEAYVANGGNATNAAKDAGYSAKTAYSAGGRLLKDVEIAAEIERRKAETLEAAQEQTGVTIAGVLGELRDMVHSDVRKVFDQKTGALLPVHEWPADVARGVASVKVQEMAGGMAVGGEGGVQHVAMFTKEVKLWDKNSAVEKAMKHLGLFKKDNEQTPPVVVMRGVRSVAFDPFRGRGAAK